MAGDELAARKNDHLDIVLDPSRTKRNGSTGFAAFAFEHCALPELHLQQINLGTTFLGCPLRAPLLISSMTGGPAQAATINRHLAEAAQALGIALGVGSQRIALETGTDHGLGVPLVVKEVGAGISAAMVRHLVAASVTVIDVAGAGGTNWVTVEAQRARTPAQKQAALAFADWGIPAAEALREVHQACLGTPLIASDGIRDGVDLAKAIRLGGDLVGQAPAALPGALRSSKAVIEHFNVIIEQLRIDCFRTGSADLTAPRQARVRSPAQPPL
ncbi:alpha-hydroxy-acid oxidizing protein [Azorhizophilus paspali]|uniref:Alpha-hydroxy-acid oxidizing protein n=1 Tax=Azorhizophilus paspali TaxID=69963 RepID=A0ABV6SQH9_AZOPA